VFVQIAVASGKGVQEKRPLPPALRLVGWPGKVRYFDCDVEAPNGHLFLKPAFSESTRQSFKFHKFKMRNALLVAGAWTSANSMRSQKLAKTFLSFRNYAMAVEAARGIVLKPLLLKSLTQLEHWSEGWLRKILNFPWSIDDQ
jgi:hypothetical protein